jgi:HEPN domain-containing protein
MSTRPPLWGNFVAYADWDLLSFAWLYEGGLRVPGYYHATQAVEKYLKALALSILDPGGVTETASNKKWIHTHDLDKLAIRCADHFPFYGQAEIQARMKRFSEFDQTARYPWTKQKLGNGFTSSDVPLLCDLVRHLRIDLPIKVDDYILGMLLRGHHQGHPEASANLQSLAQLGRCVAALRRVFPDVDTIVRR